jgi:hypothetical protein
VSGASINQPALFIAGTADPVLANAAGRAAVAELSAAVPGLRRTVRQEKAGEVTAALLAFFAKAPVALNVKRPPLMARNGYGIMVARQAVDINGAFRQPETSHEALAHSVFK